jgi:hypothetical protein
MVKNAHRKGAGDGRPPLRTNPDCKLMGDKLVTNSFLESAVPFWKRRGTRFSVANRARGSGLLRRGIQRRPSFRLTFRIPEGMSQWVRRIDEDNPGIGPTSGTGVLNRFVPR